MSSLQRGKSYKEIQYTDLLENIENTHLNTIFYATSLWFNYKIIDILNFLFSSCKPDGNSNRDTRKGKDRYFIPINVTEKKF